MTENEAKAIRWISNIRDDIVIVKEEVLDNKAMLDALPRTIRQERNINAEIIINAISELDKYRSIGTVEKCREAMKIHNKACSHQLAYYDHNGHRYNGQVRFTEGIGNHDGQGNPITLQ